MSYADTLDYLYTRLPMFSRIGAAAYKKDLTNTLALCEELGQPQETFKTIHIAGTNGKGSVSHMLASVLQTAGYKTGLYTSPHLQDFRERIRVNGQMVPESFVVDFTEQIKPAIDRIEPSFFEITVAMAFAYFAQEKVDVAVIETGLGGRLDSTNVIHPELAVITNIGWDHMNMLGDTLELIAGEKAGIIKPGVPVVIGEWLSETRPVFEQTAKARQAPIVFAGEQRDVISTSWENGLLNVQVASSHTTGKETYTLDLPGIYQARNLLTVLASLDILQQKDWNITAAQISEGLRHAKRNTGLRGRWEILRKEPLLVVDVAHNVNGMEQMLEQIRCTPHRQLHLVMGMVRDKDSSAVFNLLPRDARYYFTRAQIPRALPEEELKELATKAGLEGQAYSNVHTALYAASLKAQKEDLIIVCGSIFLAGEISAAALKAIWGADGDLNWTGDFLEMALN